MMMDNAALHHQVIQSSTPTANNSIQQQQQNPTRTMGESEHFLTIRLLMQGKVSYF